MPNVEPNSIHRCERATRVIREEIEYASKSDAKVLITGESGVGKEVVAQLIHQQSRRRNAPLVTINCAGVPDTLLASELFGHMRGSFTDAHRDKPGWLEQANRGTIFLDEVGEMSLSMQSLLLRFLENGEIQRVGSERLASKVDVRVIAATNRKLVDRIAANEFREDLFYRLNVIHIPIPPLRERREDIPLLLDYFLRTFSTAHGVERPTAQRRRRGAIVGERLAGQRASGAKRRRASCPEGEERHHHHRRPAERGAFPVRAEGRARSRSRPSTDLRAAVRPHGAPGRELLDGGVRAVHVEGFDSRRSSRDCAAWPESDARQLQGHGAVVQRARGLQAAIELPAEVSVPSSHPGIPDGVDSSLLGPREVLERAVGD